MIHGRVVGRALVPTHNTGVFCQCELLGKEAKSPCCAPTRVVAGCPIAAPPCGLYLGGESLQLLFRVSSANTHFCVKMLDRKLEVGIFRLSFDVSLNHFCFFFFDGCYSCLPILIFSLNPFGEKHQIKGSQSKRNVSRMTFQL